MSVGIVSPYAPTYRRKDFGVPSFSPADETYMDEALALAARARGRTAPNPLVGAVVVGRGAIVGRGYHHAAGKPHAEMHALMQAGPLAFGGTLYVTLEPCNHVGRTGPCTEAILAAGITRVVYATRDPNPAVRGGGARRLRRANVPVDGGLRAREARHLNAAFLTTVLHKRPRVIAKWAMTLDGKIATRTGHSRWVTGPAAREHAHQLRDHCDAIIVGRGTVEADDPALTTRLSHGRGRDPMRIVLDSRARTPVTARVVRTTSDAPTVIATTLRANHPRVRKLERAGATAWPLRARKGGVSWRALLSRCLKADVHSVLVEGGPRVLASLWEAGVVDEVVCYVAPKVCGGEGAPSPIGGVGPARMDRLPGLWDLSMERLGEDVCLRGWVRPLEP